MLPSVAVEEMFGLVVLEAMAAAAGDHHGGGADRRPRGERPGETGLEVPVHDVRSLAEALGRWRTIPTCGVKMGMQEGAGEKFLTRQVMEERAGGAV
ncbi:MAG: hypothetical protein IPK12_22385 [Gemmatimonadetes bacterium]|nr:hypothetical protein [Gemmatimonadota bacterium]